MALSVNILGPLVIECNSVPLPKVPRKARALMAYLAAQGGRPISRERLADLLWPYQGSDQSRHSLRNCLLQLRQVLGKGIGHHLVSEFADCRLIEVDVDLDRCKRLARSAELADLLTAAECYRGEFLADFVLESEPFQEWLTAERDNALELVCGILQRLTGLQDEAGEYAGREEEDQEFAGAPRAFEGAPEEEQDQAVCD